MTEDELFRTLRRAPFATAFDTYKRATTPKVNSFNCTVPTDNAPDIDVLLEPLGWTFSEFQEELKSSYEPWRTTKLR